MGSNKNDAPVTAAGLKWVLQEVLGSLPERRDWLNPDAEREMRAMLKELNSPVVAAPAVPNVGGLTPERVMALYDEAISKDGSADNIILNTAWAIEREVLATKAAAAEPELPSAIPGTKEQALVDLMPKRAAFLKWCKERGLDVTEDKDAWGQRKFKHSHIEALWCGWFNAPTEAAPAAPEQAVPEGFKLLQDLSKWDGSGRMQKANEFSQRAAEIIAHVARQTQAAPVVSGGLTEGQRCNAELVVARLEQIKHIAEGIDARGLAADALVCANAILAAPSSTEASAQAAPEEVRTAVIVEVAEHFDPSATQVITERDAYRRILALRTTSTDGSAA